MAVLPRGSTALSARRVYHDFDGAVTSPRCDWCPVQGDALRAPFPLRVTAEVVVNRMIAPHTEDSNPKFLIPSDASRLTTSTEVRTSPIPPSHPSDRPDTPRGRSHPPPRR